MGLELETVQKQAISQNMIQSMEILQMNAQELEHYIENLAMENPMIELPDTRPSKHDFQQEDIQRKMDWLESTDLQNRVYYQQERNSGNMEQNWHDKRDLEPNLREFLLAQLLLEKYSKEERAIIDFLIESLDSRGYLMDDIFSIAQYFSAEESKVLELLHDIQKLDPAGVAARDLPECLLLQLERTQSGSECAKKIVASCLDDMAKNHLSAIAKQLNATLDEVKQACAQIRRLNPKPGNSFSDREQLRYISPDAVIVKLEDTFEILINEYQYPDIVRNTYYAELLQNTTDGELRKYLEEKDAQITWVRNCIASRAATLSAVLHILTEKQKKFFLYGPAHRIPLKLCDIADEAGVHESTVSRTLKGKYLQCSWGVFPLNYFIVSSVSKGRGFAMDGEERTAEQVKALIREIIDAEDKKRPLSDQKISELLQQKNVSISRRTVNKYRVQMGLPDRSGRRRG